MKAKGLEFKANLESMRLQVVTQAVYVKGGGTPKFQDTFGDHLMWVSKNLKTFVVDKYLLCYTEE